MEKNTEHQPVPPELHLAPPRPEWAPAQRAIVDYGVVFNTATANYLADGPFNDEPFHSFYGALRDIGPYDDDGRVAVRNALLATFEAVGLAEGKWVSNEEALYDDQCAANTVMALLSSSSHDFLALAAAERHCAVSELGSHLQRVDYERLTSEALADWRHVLTEPVEEPSYPLLDFSITGAALDAGSFQQAYFEDLEKLNSLTTTLYSAAILSGRPAVASKTFRQVEQLIRLTDEKIPPEPQRTLGLGLVANEKIPHMGDRLSREELRMVIAERFLSALEIRLKKMSMASKNELLDLRRRMLRRYQDLAQPNWLEVIEYGKDLQVQWPPTNTLPASTTLAENQPPHQDTGRRPEIPELADKDIRRLDFKVLPVKKGDGGSALLRTAENMLESAQKRSKRPPEELRIDRRRIRAQERIRHVWAQMQGEDDPDQTSYYARGNWEKAPVVIDGEFEQPGDYIILVLQQRDPQTGKILEHAVANTPLTRRDGGSAMYVIREDAAAGQWWEIMSQNRPDARGSGARAVVHSATQDQNLEEAMAQKALYLLTAPVEEFTKAHNHLGRTAVRQLGKTTLQQIAAVELPEM